MLIEKLNPREGDVIIIGGADNNEKTAELGAKNAALLTIFSHEKNILVIITELEAMLPCTRYRETITI
jgi:hypothetical protein